MKPRKFLKVTVAFSACLLIAGASYTNAYANEVQQQQEIVEASYEQFVTTANLNLRSGPSTDYARIFLIPNGTVIQVHNFDPYGFSEVVVNGQAGYVSSEFIRKFDPSNSPTISPVSINGNVELLPWSQVRQIMPVGTRIEVLDVLTGRVYFVRNFSNGNHADVEPITQNDTDIIRATSGGRWSWDPRPVIVSFNGRHIAAAINTMPHGGSTISGNGMNGHLCLHFFESRTHNGNRTYEADMQRAVRQAFNSAN